HKPRRVINERDEKDLLHGAAWANGEIWTILKVRMPETIPMPLLKPPCGDAGLGVHAHMARAVPALGQPLLQCTAFDLARLDAALPLKNLDELRDASAWYFPPQENGLFQHLRRDRRFRRPASLALGFQTAKTFFAVLRQIPAQRALGEPGL